jgi:amidohydrolase
MDELRKKIKDLSSEYFEEVRRIRHHLHANPELSTEEKETAVYICGKLDEYGIPYKRGIAGNGIVALVKGNDSSGWNIALRADMDALPISEENEAEYKSKREGIMHACGHDVHMAVLLGTAKILQKIRSDFRGSVKLIFQPSEETYPGGAIGMIRENVLHDPETRHVVALHVINTLDAGTVGMKAGAYMASTDEVFLTVKGKGGHAATPDQVVDPILIASHILVALQQIVSRKANPVMPTVVSFGKIRGEGRTNIIPEEVTVEGTVRTYDESWRKKIHDTIRMMSASIAESMGGTCEVRIAHGYPFLKNDPDLTSKLHAYSTEYLGEKNVTELVPRMTAEDFSYFAEEVPSCLFRLGVRNEKNGIVANLHSSTFDVDESCMETGTGTMAFLAVRLLSSI